MKIRLLSDNVINQIAAGEVVERPVSVVRELIDNSLDAGANDISISINSGGQSSITIQDNGSGMSKDDALLAFERHATSKISSLEDLRALPTLGFRGEALASIGAVSKITLRTRTKEDKAATEIIMHGGKVIKVSACAAPVGTEIEVRQLFFNTPARKKFLRSPRTDENKIINWVGQISIVRPGVRLRLTCDGSPALNLPLCKDLFERARQVFKMPSVNFKYQHSGGVKICGMVTRPDLAQSDSAGLTIIVNDRVVSDKIIARAVKDGFFSTLKEKEFPIGFVSVTLDPAEVDVNVHPQKSEVRFNKPDLIFAAVRNAVEEGLRDLRGPAIAMPAIDAAASRSNSSRTPSTTGSLALRISEPLDPSTPRLTRGSGLEARPAISSISISDNTPVYTTVKNDDFRFSDLVFRAKVLDCYLVCEHNENLVVVDMHAAHERINYNKILSAVSKKSIPQQKLLIPLEIQLHSEGLHNVNAHTELLETLGFDFKTNDVAVVVRGIPAIPANLNVTAFIKDVAAEELSEAALKRYEDRVSGMVARLACHASVRSGDSLNAAEVQALFNAMDSNEFSAACPHGRPVVVHFSMNQVERWFGRDR